MSIFVIGLSKSGRTNLSQSLSEKLGFVYINSVSWLYHTFRNIKDSETELQYQEAKEFYFLERLKVDPNVICRNTTDTMSCYPGHNFVIDGCLNPKDFVTLFDYNKDVVIFLNRLDNEAEYKDYDNIAISTIKDYCYWLSSTKLINRERWLEFNFPMLGTDNITPIKELGNHNKILICRSFKSVVDSCASFY